MKPYLKFFDETKKRELEPLCRKVLDSLELPNCRTVCIFDGRERKEFADHPDLGPFFCGFFNPVHRFGLRFAPWPPVVVSCFFKGKIWLYDEVVYLRHQTCQSPVGTVITFAHELTHLRQYGFHYKAWLAEKMVRKVYTGEPLAPWLLPIEYEAQLCSKRIAIAILGCDEVTAHANKQIAKKFDDSELELAQKIFHPKWEFFLELDTEQTFDLTKEVDGWVRKYKADLVKWFPNSQTGELDFTKENWWE